MRVLLIHHGCEAALEVQPADMEAQAKAELNKKAHSAVILCLGNKVLGEVTGETTTAGVWSKLETLYMTKSLANKLYLKMKLYTFYMPAGRKIFEHIDEFNKIVLDLANIVNVKATLNSKEIKERSKAKGNHGEGLYRNCLKNNCKKSTCYIKKDGQSRSSGLTYDDSELMMVMSAEALQDWIMNSGCSYHMTPMLDIFFDFLECFRGSVLLGDNKEYKIRGIGKGYTVKLQSGKVKVINGSRVEEKDSLAHVWHKRLGHISKAGLQVLEKQGLFGKKSLGKLDFCTNYVLGKSHRVSFSVGRHTTQGVIDYVHSDLWGLSQVESLGGKRYFLSIVDDYSKRVWIYIFRFKHEAFRKFKEWKQLVENQTGRTVKKLRTDNGLELCNREFEQLCIESGIARHLTVAGTPQQNGLAERMNITLMDKVRCLLIQSGFPKTFWAEATCTAAYLINRSPSTAIEKKTPMEMWSGHPSDYGMLRIFGCVAYPHDKQGKLEPRAVKCVLLGYPEGVKGYRLYMLDNESPKIVTSRNVVKVELQGLNNRTLEEDHTDQEDGDDEDTGDQEINQTPDLIDYQLARGKEPRTRMKPLRFQDESNMATYVFVTTEEEDTHELLIYQEAVSCEDSSKWKAAIKEEMDSLRKNKTWELVDHPIRQKLVSHKWLFKTKEGIEGVQKSRYKARLVARGFTLRVDYELEQLDVNVGICTLGILKKVIYMRKPPGYVQVNNYGFKRRVNDDCSLITGNALDVLDLRSVETEFPAIVFNDSLTSNETPSCEPTVSSLNNNEIDFRISFDESDDEDYTVVGYTKEIVHDFEQRLETIFGFGREDEDGIHQDDGRRIGDEMGLDVAGTLCFQLGGARRSMTWRQFILALGLHTAEEMAEDGFGAYWLGSERVIPSKGDLSDYWVEISSSRDFLRGAPLYTYIRDPVRRLCHRLISYNNSGRGQEPEKVTVIDLFYLRSMDRGVANVPYLLAQYLFRHIDGRKSGARLSGGHFIRRLAHHFGMVSDDGLRGLSVVAPSGPKRQQVAAAGAPEAAEDAPAVDEGAQADPAPVQAPQPPPPPPAAGRTMP
ncbi:retrotransposon protein, putative, ty1-copia subclass [Tanacetum coccineum]